MIQSLVGTARRGRIPGYTPGPSVTAARWVPSGHLGDNPLHGMAMNHQPKSWLLAGLAVLIGGVACGGGSDGGPPASGRKTVLVVNNEFQPLTTTISAGDTVLWSWSTNSSMHNIISTGSPSFASNGTTAFPGVAGTDYFNAPASYQVVYPSSGTYEYYCSQHGTSTGAPGGNTGMHGVVQVNP